MRELGYVYHRGAANLRSRHSSIVGVLITDISNPSFAKLMLGIEERLAAAGYFTMLSNTFDDKDREVALLQSFIEHPVDAIVYVPVSETSDEIEATLAASTVPVLAVTRQPVGGGSYLGQDNFMGGQMSAEHLIQVHGCRRLAFLGGPALGAARRERLEGVRNVVDSHPGVELVYEIEGPTTVEAVRKIGQAAVDSGVAFDGVVCHSDLVAYAFLRAWRDRDSPFIPVIGFDDLPTSEFFEPSVTSIAVGPLGRRAAERIIAMMDGAEDTVELIKPELQVRLSCGCH
jgi:LacI family transcriptional regulator